MAWAKSGQPCGCDWELCQEDGRDAGRKFPCAKDGIQCGHIGSLAITGRATSGVLVVESHPSYCCGRLSRSLWHGCCLPAQGIGSVCILCPSETICHQGRARSALADMEMAGRQSLQRGVFHRTTEPSSTMGVAMPCSQMASPDGPCAPALRLASRPSPTTVPRCVSPAPRSAANGEPSRQASPPSSGQRGGRDFQDAADANEAPPITSCCPALGSHVATSCDGHGVIRLLPGVTSRLSRERSVLPPRGVKGRRRAPGWAHPPLGPASSPAHPIRETNGSAVWVFPHWLAACHANEPRRHFLC